MTIEKLQKKTLMTQSLLSQPSSLASFRLSKLIRSMIKSKMMTITLCLLQKKVMSFLVLLLPSFAVL